MINKLPTINKAQRFLPYPNKGLSGILEDAWYTVTHPAEVIGGQLTSATSTYYQNALKYVNSNSFSVKEAIFYKGALTKDFNDGLITKDQLSNLSVIIDARTDKTIVDTTTTPHVQENVSTTSPTSTLPGTMTGANPVGDFFIKNKNMIIFAGVIIGLVALSSTVKIFKSVGK